MSNRILSFAVIFLGLGLIANGVALLFDETRLQQQQRQIDQLNSAIFNFVRSQDAEADTRPTGIEGGREYEVVFIDFKKRIAVLKSKNRDGKIEYSIHCDAYPATLEEWATKRHFRG